MQICQETKLFSWIEEKEESLVALYFEIVWLESPGEPKQNGLPDPFFHPYFREFLLHFNVREKVCLANCNQVRCHN